MSWKIVSINNATHAVTLGHTDGYCHSFTVPNSHVDRANKINYIADQAGVAEGKRLHQRDLDKIAAKELRWLRIMKLAVVIETLILIGILCRHNT